MSVTLAGLKADRGGVQPADLLYRLTGLSYFSPAARAYRTRYRRALRELQLYTFDELAELGLQRCDIRRVAGETAARA